MYGLMMVMVLFYYLIIMFHQADELLSKQSSRKLQVDLNIQEEPEWLDSPQPPRNNKKQQKKALPSLTQPIDPLLQELNSQLDKSKKGLPKGTINRIKGKAEQLEYAVFVGETTSNKNEYFDKLYEHTTSNPYVKEEISQTVMQTHHIVQKDIHRNNINMNDRVIPRNKGQMRELENRDQVRLIELKQGEIKNKIGSLRQEFQKESLKEKLRNKINTIEHQHLEKNFYSIDHPRTKEAEDFVKDLQYRKMQHQRELEEQMATRQQLLMRRREQEEMEKEREKQQRKTKLEEYYQSKLVQRMEEKEREKQKRAEYQEWVKSFQREKPLELEKEEEFRMKVLIPQMEEQHKKLMTIKAEHRPIDPEEINQHEEKYIEFKKDNSIRKKAELELRREEDENEENEMNEKLYKGKYRYLVLEQMIDEKYPINQKEIEQSKKDRIKAYNEHLRSFHHETLAPHKDQKIEAETISNQKFVKRVRNMNGSMNITNRQQETVDKDHHSERAQRKSAEDRDPYKHGIQNLAFLKSMMREQKAKEEESPPLINLVQEKQVAKPKGFLQQCREKKDNKKKKLAAVSKEIQETAVSANEQIGALKAKAQMLDERLKRKETKIKNIESNKFEEGQNVEEDYVHAIKAKIHMLNQFD